MSLSLRVGDRLQQGSRVKQEQSYLLKTKQKSRCLLDKSKYEFMNRAEKAS